MWALSLGMARMAEPIITHTRVYAAGENWAWTFQTLEALEWEIFNFCSSSEDCKMFLLGTFQSSDVQSMIYHQMACQSMFVPSFWCRSGKQTCICQNFKNVYSIYVILNIRIGFYAVRPRVRCRFFWVSTGFIKPSKFSGPTWQLRNHCLLLCIHCPQTDLQFFIVFCFVI